MPMINVLRRVVPAAGLLFAVAVAFAPPAAAVDLSGGCKGSGQSVDKAGAPVDQAVAPGPGGTRSKPFLVDFDGTVKYEGGTPTVFKNHRWDVKVFGVKVKSGGSPNDSNETSTNGTAVVKDYLPFRFTGLYFVSGGITSVGGACSGSMWVKITGSPVGTVPWVVGIVFSAGGAVVLIWSLPTAKGV